MKTLVKHVSVRHLPISTRIWRTYGEFWVPAYLVRGPDARRGYSTSPRSEGCSRKRKELGYEPYQVVETV